jgi:hypothetical protein
MLGDQVVDVASIIYNHQKQEAKMAKDKKSAYEVEKENKKAWQTPKLRKTDQEKGTAGSSGSGADNVFFS